MSRENEILEAGKENATNIQKMDEIDETGLNQEDDDDSVDDEANNHNILDESGRSFPCLIFNVTNVGEAKFKLERLVGDEQKGMEVFELPHRDWRGLTYKRLLKQLYNEDQWNNTSNNVNDNFLERGFLFDPDVLDDPDLFDDIGTNSSNTSYGSNRFLLQRSSSTGPIPTSALYVTKQDLKSVINDQFRERHPGASSIPLSTLTITEIRDVKKAILLNVTKLDIELSTLAMAFIYFERLCLKGLVNKTNRKLSMAVTLLLAMKFNETNTIKYKKSLEAMLEFCDEEWNLSKKQIFDAEFGAFVHLGFLLHIPYQHIHYMYTRLLLFVNARNLLSFSKDNNIQQVYIQDIQTLERQKEYNRMMKEQRLRQRSRSMSNSSSSSDSDSDSSTSSSSDDVKETHTPHTFSSSKKDNNSPISQQQRQQQGNNGGASSSSTSMHHHSSHHHNSQSTSSHRTKTTSSSRLSPEQRASPIAHSGKPFISTNSANSSNHTSTKSSSAKPDNTDNNNLTDDQLIDLEEGEMTTVSTKKMNSHHPNQQNQQQAASQKLRFQENSLNMKSSSKDKEKEKIRKPRTETWDSLV